MQPDKEKQKTPVIKKDCNPVWNCTMVFDDVTVGSLKEKSLELTIWDYDKLSSNDFLGGVRLNLGTGKKFNFIPVYSNKGCKTLVLSISVGF